MKRTLAAILMTVLLLSCLSLGVGALSANVDASSWESAELKALYVQSNGDIYSDLNEDYFEYWWEDEIPELENFFQASTVNMRGFAMSPDGRYLYMGTLNGGTGVRGAVVYDTKTCVVTDLYYHYDGEAGLEGSPFSYAKGIAADDRGYVYVGFAFSRNFNVVNLGIAKQNEDGTVQEVALEAVANLGEAGDESGIHIGVNGVDVAKVGDKYYCYVMTNYDYDALYCVDVTDPAAPTLNEDFGVNGVIEFSEPSNTVAGAGFTLKEGQYMDVDEDGIIWLAVNANEGTDGVMKIAPDGSACAEVVTFPGVYCVEHEGGYLLLGRKDGSAVAVLDDASYETVAEIPLTEDYGDRITRIQVINDVLFVCDAGNDTTNFNAIHAAPLSAEGQEFFDSLVANLSQSNGEDTDAPTEAPTDAPTEAPTDKPAEGDGETDAPTEAPIDTPTEAPSDGGTEPTDTPSEGGCGSGVGLAALLTAAAAGWALRKKD